MCRKRIMDELMKTAERNDVDENEEMRRDKTIRVDMDMRASKANTSATERWQRADG